MKTFLDPLDAKEEAALLQQMEAGSQKAKHKLIEHNMRLVAHVAKKYYSPKIIQFFYKLNDTELNKHLLNELIGVRNDSNGFYSLQYQFVIFHEYHNDSNEVYHDVLIIILLSLFHIPSKQKIVYPYYHSLITIYSKSLFNHSINRIIHSLFSFSLR